MDKFAGYLTTVVDELEKEHGIRFDTIDPFNEPNTNYWSTNIPAGQTWPTSASRQEGAHIGPQRQDEMIKALAARLADPDTTTDAVISAMDETNPGIFATNWNTWSPAAKAAVDQLNVHTYGTQGRPIVRDIAKAADKPLWMSEVEGNWTPARASTRSTSATVWAWRSTSWATSASWSPMPGCSGSPSKTCTTWRRSSSSTGAASSSTSTATPTATPSGA